MRALVKSVSESPLYAKAFQWIKLFALTGTTQIGIQVVSFASGILILRLLPTQEYAIYTLAVSMLGAMTMIADGGISTGVVSQAGRVWNDKTRLGAVMATGIELRQKLSLGCILIATPLTYILLRNQNVSLSVSVTTLICLTLVFSVTMSGYLIDFPSKLWQDVVPLQKVQIKAAMGRLFISGIFLLIFPFSFIAVVSNFLPQLWANKGIKRNSTIYADFTQKPDPVVRHKIKEIVKLMLPNAIYSCLSGQITIWIISVVGSVTLLAQVGALGRYAMIFGIYNVIFNTLLSPRFARMPNDPRLLLKRFTQLHLFLVMICIGIIGFVYLFPAQTLWILGERYSNLRNEIVLSIGASCVGLIASSSFYVCSTRGWALNPIFSIPINLFSIIICAFFIDVSTIHGILLFNLIIISVQAVINVIYCLLRIIKIK